MDLSQNDIKEIAIQEDNLNFKYLPEYAAFLLKYHLEDYVKIQLQYFREEKVPILRFFAHLSDEELIAQSMISSREFLTVLVENRASAHIRKSLSSYIKNQIPLIEREQLVAEDITMISFVRRKLFRKYINLYTQDRELDDNIREELDRFVVESEAASINAYIQVQQEKISQINAELAQRQADLLEAQELTQMGSFLWDFSGVQSIYTPGVMKIFDIPHAGNLNSFIENVHEDDRANLKAAIESAIKDNGIYECEYRYIKGGKEKRIWSRGLVNYENGKPVSMRGTIMDISSKHKMLTMLQQSEEYLQHLIYWAPDAIIVIDENNRINLWNPKAEEIFGWHAAETIGKMVSEIIIPANYHVAYNNEINILLAQQESNKNLEIIACDKSKREFYVSLTASRSVQQGKVLYILFLRDISQEKQNKIELQSKTIQLESLNASLEFKNSELERINRELESFNYVASHDLQEPLRKIQTFTSRILEKGNDNLPPATVEYFNKIITSSARMQLLIEDLLMFSQTTASVSNFEQCNLNTILDEVKIILSASIEEKKAIIEAMRLPVVNGIPFQLQQLLLNLIGNAIKYSKEQSAPHVKITTALVKGRELDVPLLAEDKYYVELVVEDNGIGFEDENAEKIFGLFQRLHNKDKYSGTGIGLAICKKIAHSHKGFIKAKSVLSKGSAFYVYLPHEKVVETVVN